MNAKARNLVGGLCSVLIAVALLPAAADGQTRFGVRAGFYTNHTDPFFGADVLVPLKQSWFLDPNLEAVFGDHEDDFVVALDAHYDLPVASPPYVWLGGGPAIVVRDISRPGDNQTDAGFDLLMGAGFPTKTGLIPYLQFKVLLSANTRGVVAVGIRF
jgi:hypothetical protein